MGEPSAAVIDTHPLIFHAAGGGQLGARAAYFKQALHEKLIDHKTYIAKHGDDMPAISGWKWGGKATAGERGTSTEGDNV